MNVCCTTSTATAGATTTTTIINTSFNNANLVRLRLIKTHRFSCPILPITRSPPRAVVVCCQNRTPKAVAPSVVPLTETCDRIGIVGFIQGKNYFVTGATGFLAKALVEKLLRTVPDVGKIFVLIRAKDKEAAEERLYTDIINSDLFDPLRQMYGKPYEAFVKSKLVPVVGNMGEDNLGMDSDTADEIAEEIDVIVSSAATTTFNERYDIALNINAGGPSRLLSFANKCNNLSLFLHFSTAYVNGEREGMIKEKPFYMGQTIAAERIISETSPISVPELDIGAEMELVSRMAETCNHKEVTLKMKELAQERANMYGWPNCYSFTKAMGEMVINSLRGDFPAVIVRPSVIESSYREPFPGWIQGNRMLDPLILSYGKGHLPGFVFDPRAIIDVIPVDMVVNATMAAMAKHGLAGKPELNVYHVGSSSVNPLRLGELFKLSCNHFTHSPIRDPRGEEIKITEMEFFSSVEDFSSYISNIITKQERANGVSRGKLQSALEMKCKRKAEHLTNMAKLYKPYMFCNGGFDNTNTQRLMEEMSLEERWMLGFDVSSIDWEHYIMKVHIPGLMRHVMKGRFISG